MTDHPILFSGPMVRALLDGRKTQTRRVINPQPPSVLISVDVTKDGFNMAPANLFGSPTHRMLQKLRRSGDRLWVREAWRAYNRDDKVPPRDMRPSAPIWYEADVIAPGDPIPVMRGRLRASMHMPRWASRLTLKVTEVRVQRLQDISEDDAAAEGWPAPEDRAKEGAAEIRDAYPIGWFAHLWDSLNAARGFGWEANPWVTVTTFEVIKGNIDEVKA